MQLRKDNSIKKLNGIKSSIGNVVHDTFTPTNK